MAKHRLSNPTGIAKRKAGFWLGLCLICLALGAGVMTFLSRWFRFSEQPTEVTELIARSTFNGTKEKGLPAGGSLLFFHENSHETCQVADRLFCNRREWRLDHGNQAADEYVSRGGFHVIVYRSKCLSPWPAGYGSAAIVYSEKPSVLEWLKE